MRYIVSFPYSLYYVLGHCFLVAALEHTLHPLMKFGGPFTCYVFASHGYLTVLCVMAVFAWICRQECLEYSREVRFLHRRVTTFWIRLSHCLSSSSLLVLADPRYSRLIRGGFSYSFCTRFPPDSPTPRFVFWLLICSHSHHWKGRTLCFPQASAPGRWRDR